MEWHESLREILARGNQHQEGKDDDDNDEDAETTTGQPPAAQQVADLLVVDNAKAHRRFHEGGQSTVAETRSSSSSSLDDTELSILFEDVDLYDDDDDDCDKDFHRSFPVTRRHSRRRRRRRRRRQERNEQSAALIDNDDVQELLARWGSNSDSLLDYNSLDDMLREGNSQTASARANVFQPERRRSFEVSFLDVEELNDIMSVTTIDDDGSDMDCKPPPTVSS